MSNVDEIINEFKTACKKYKVQFLTTDLETIKVQELSYFDKIINEPFFMTKGVFKVKLNECELDIDYCDRKYVSPKKKNGKYYSYGRGEENKLPFRIKTLDRNYKRMESLMKAVYIAVDLEKRQLERKIIEDREQKELVKIGRDFLKENHLEGFKMTGSWSSYASFQRDNILIECNNSEQGVTLQIKLSEIEPTRKIFREGGNILNDIILHINNEQ